ncbi:HBR124Cp [Eremothecium sinecaudum]|uniref:21S rRNA pseudouridine(2819) synthase n=1 Tax=Eremothecium sinecaudum TaxID=45286 RepID=A0A109UWY6_9SACH|nr:HBR124Cp [Eremothecium sinecaudum]AMD19025.1 HBR124Cp [Eremothecium sinecaudum]
MKRWNLPLISQNSHYIIVNKPCGVLCQPPDIRTWYRHHNYDPPVLTELLIEQYGNDWRNELRSVHRLDKDVTGGVLVACNKNAAAKFSTNLAYGGNRGFKFIRRYVAVVSGEMINNIPNEGRILMGDTVSDYKRLYPNLLILQLGTGRKHQIRRLLRDVFKQPIKNDVKFGASLVSGIGPVIGLHSGFISTQIGLKKESHLIPIPSDVGTLKLWHKYIDNKGNFSTVIAETLCGFQIPDSLDQELKLTGLEDTTIFYRSKIDSF